MMRPTGLWTLVAGALVWVACGDPPASSPVQDGTGGACGFAPCGDGDGDGGQPDGAGTGGRVGEPEPSTGGGPVAGGTTGAGGSGGFNEGSGGALHLEIDQGPLTMWYDAPADVWNEALPLGNGRLGAMVFGGPNNERIQLNESSFWSGGPSRNDNPSAKNALANVRQLLFDGQWKQAETAINQNMTAAALHGSMYQTLGDLSLNLAGHENHSNYYRELDLKRAVFSMHYEVDGVTFTREVFVSKPDQVMVVRLSADAPAKLTLSVGIDGPLANGMTVVDPTTLELRGNSSNHEGVQGRVKFNARVKVKTTGGTTQATSQGIDVNGADEVVLLVSMATNFVDYKTVSANEAERALEYLGAVEAKSWQDLLSAHVSAYQGQFNRAALSLGDSSSDLPTDQRIAQFSQTGDRELVSMYYQFGRYLLISSSQPGGQAANLQGLWNGSTNPAWDSKYTININTEMNYWPAEKTSLSELHEPLFRLIRELSEAGAQTAETMYGADGWVAHHNTDIWRISGVVDGAYWGMWPMGGAWLSQHLWEHYLYGGDRDFLETSYPIMKSAAEFFQDFLIPEPDHQWLVVSPSISPENEPAGHGTSVVYGATMDNQLVFDLLTKTIRAAEILDVDAEFRAQLQQLVDRLPPMQVGRFGQLQEWLEDWDNPNDQHRHISHLYGLYPSSQISPYDSPELFSAARTTLEHRGDVSTGWSMGWKVNFWARLLDGDHALELIRAQLTLVDPVTEPTGGTFPNFLDSHPPFQIDGNFGCTAGIAEMLMQSHAGAVHVLPALPGDWAEDGGVAGLRAYGGFDLDFIWSGGEVEQLAVRSALGGNLRLRVPNSLRVEDGGTLTEATGDNPNQFFATPAVHEPVISPEAEPDDPELDPTFLYDLSTDPGRSYLLVRNP